MVYKIYISLLCVAVFLPFDNFQDIFCPEDGVLNDFNQRQQNSTRCLFLAPIDRKTNNSIMDGQNSCKKFFAALAYPENPQENHLLSIAIKKRKKKDSKAMINVVITLIEKSGPDFKVQYKLNGKELAESYKQSKQQMEMNLIEARNIKPFAYFLQSEADLSSLKNKSVDELAVFWTSAKATWEIHHYRVNSTAEGDFAMCHSPFYKACKLIEAPCEFDAERKACVTKFLFDPTLCPAGTPQYAFCRCPTCQRSEWSPWSECGGECDKRRKFRIRISLSPNVANCQDDYEFENCTRCYYCDIGSWTSWSERCDQICGEREISRTRSNSVLPNASSSASGRCLAYEDSKSCKAEKPCNQNCIQIISPWSQCTATCGARGVRKRTVTPKMVKNGRGHDCPIENTTEWCPAKECPRDCIYSPWIDSSCSVTCGKGKITRNRNITKAAEYGGACSNELQRVVPCQMDPCVVNCTLSNEWGAWLACSITCGAGTCNRKKAYKIDGQRRELKENEWGYCDNPEVSAVYDTGVVCPILTDPVSTEPIEDTLKKKSKARATIIYAIVGVVSAFVIVIFFVGVFLFVRKENKKKTDLQKKEVMRQAMAEVVGESIYAKGDRRSKVSSKSPKSSLKKSTVVESTNKKNSSPPQSRSNALKQSQLSTVVSRLPLYRKNRREN